MPDDPMSQEEAAQVLRGVQTKVKDLTKRLDESGLDAFASRDDVQADIAKALKTVTEDNDRAIAAASAATRMDPSERGVSNYVTKDGSGQPVVRALGGKDPQTGVYEPGILDDPHTHGEWHKELKRAVNDLNVVRTMQKNPLRPLDKCHAPTTTRRIQNLMRTAPDAVRKIWADSANIGAEWIPDTTLPVYEEDMRLARRLESLFKTIELGPGDTKLPYLTTGARPYIKAAVTHNDPAAYTISSAATADRTFTPVGFAVRVQVDEDAAEDSILAFEPLHREMVVSAAVDGMEDAIINGDTGTHQDTGLSGWDIDSRWGSTGLGTSADHRRAWVGLRARAEDISNSTDQSGAMTAAGFLTARGKIASGYGAAADLVCVPSYFYYVKKMLGIDELETVEKYGQGASVLTGEVSKIYGVPVIQSPFMSNMLNASGIYDDSTKTKGGFLLFTKSRFIVGVRKGGMLESAKDITRGVHDIVYTVRKVFKTIDSSTKKNVHWSYNLTATS